MRDFVSVLFQNFPPTLHFLKKKSRATPHRKIFTQETINREKKEKRDFREITLRSFAKGEKIMMGSLRR